MPKVEKVPVDPAAGAAQPGGEAAVGGTAEVPKPTDKYAHVDAAGAAKLIAATPDLKIIDVRTPREFAAEHLKGAVNIDILVSGFDAAIGKLDKKVHYLVHCKSGGRSTSALNKFAKLGFENVTHLDGGMQAWLAADQPVDK